MTPASRNLELFSRDQIVGIFRGFTEGGLEFHADLALPYRSDFQRIPMHGQFLVVQLESPDEAVLGRVSSLSSEGRLTGASGEEFNIRAMREGRTVPEQLREDYLKYRVDIRVLGVLRRDERTGVQFVPSHRRLPHVGSPVAFLNDELLRHVAGHYEQGADLGFLAFGEFIYAEGDGRLRIDPWLQVRSPSTVVHFPVNSLVARRTFVFARAGFGKSNLNKLLFSNLYASTPHVTKRAGRQVPVGTLLFDPEGEYFWPDDKGRPGLCDVPALQDQVVVFTPREAPSPFYGSFIAGDIKLDIRRLRPADVISIALSPEKQDQQNVRKLKGMNDAAWMELVDIIERDGHSAELNEVCRLMRLDEGKQEAEALAGRANMTTIVRMLHDPSSRLLDTLMAALAEGKLCVVDISKLRGEAGFVLSGLLLRRIFQRNQDEFTKAEPQTIPTIAVVEEAQSVLRENHAASAPYVEWVKEGRKYDLGAVLITQQPGSIPTEILSQGDNWFLFHLLSAADLQKVRQANAHFSDDILSALLNEPIPGQGVFWSSVAGKPYPVALRVLLFEDMYPRRDANYSEGVVGTYASQLRTRFGARLKLAPTAVSTDGAARVAVAEPEAEQVSGGDEGQDVLRTYQSNAIEALRSDENFRRSIERGGIPYGVVLGILKESFPNDLDDRDGLAYSLVPHALEVVLGGRQGVVWDTEYRQNKSGGRTNFVYVLKRDT
jgi:hypothetical protein